jgi:flagellar hook-associated protein 1 FlgK
LRVTQAGLDVVSRNIANKDAAGYVRRTYTSIEQVVGQTGSGARGGAVQRTLNEIVQRQLWQESAGAAYTSTRADLHSAVNALYGEPGSDAALDATFNRFVQSLQQLKSEPSNYATRSAVLDSANELAARLNGLSDGVQDLRSQAEEQIGAGVDKVNELLSSLKIANARILAGQPDQTGAALRDERDRIIGDLATLVDVRTSEDAFGSVSVFTTSGVQLFDGQEAVRLEFDARPSVGPTSLWSANPVNRTVGSITSVDAAGVTIDFIANRSFRSGELAALIELRDVSLVQAQTQLDELAANLASALSDQQIAGVPATVGAATGFDVDTTGLQPGNTITLDYTVTPAGNQARFTFVRVNSAAALPLPASAGGDASNTVVGIDFSGGIGSVVTQIQAAVGPGFTVSNTGATLRIVDDGAGATRDVRGLTAAPTNTSLSNAGVGAPAEIPLFVDGPGTNNVYTGSYEGFSQRTGFAQRIAVNPGVLADRSRLVVYQTGPTTPQGDTTRPQLAYDRLTSQIRTFTPATGIGGQTAAYSSSVATFAQRIVQAQGQANESATRLDEGQQVAFAAIRSRFTEDAGVNIDRELASLVELQTAYAANARVITSVKELMDLLLRI